MSGFTFFEGEERQVEWEQCLWDPNHQSKVYRQRMARVSTSARRLLARERLRNRQDGPTYPMKPGREKRRGLGRQKQWARAIHDRG